MSKKQFSVFKETNFHTHTKRKYLKFLLLKNSPHTLNSISSSTLEDPKASNNNFFSVVDNGL